jgi:hypothetical protein
MTRRCWLRRGMHHKVAFWNASLVGRVFAPRARRPPGGIVRVPDIIDRLREVAPLGALGPQAPLEPLGQLCLVGAGRRDGGSTSLCRSPAELPKHYLWNVHISRLSQTQRIKSSLNAKSSLVLYC